MITIKQKNVVDSNLISDLSYQTLANFITGITIHYDKLSLFAGIKTPGDVLQQARKGKTRSSQFNIAVTGIKLRVEASARFYRGFFENNSPEYIPDFTDTTAYYQDPDMRNTSLKLKGFYFLNRKKRFSYGAAYINNVRQLKSAGSFIICSNIYHYKINSANPLVPQELRSYYQPWETFNKFNVTAVSGGIGYTHTFAIFKRFFINLLITASMEGRHLQVSDENKTYKNWKTTLSAFDLRSSFGYNSKRFFISSQLILDANNYVMPDMDISTQYLNGVFVIGYRFGIKKPGFYERMRK
jgi:hypothetical protein